MFWAPLRGPTLEFKVSQNHTNLNLINHWHPILGLLCVMCDSCLSFTGCHEAQVENMKDCSSTGRLEGHRSQSLHPISPTGMTSDLLADSND